MNRCLFNLEAMVGLIYPQPPAMELGKKDRVVALFVINKMMEYSFKNIGGQLVGGDWRIKALQLPDWPYHKRCRISLSISSPSRYFSLSQFTRRPKDRSNNPNFDQKKVWVFTTVRATENKGRRSSKELAVKKSGMVKF